MFTLVGLVCLGGVVLLFLTLRDTFTLNIPSVVNWAMGGIVLTFFMVHDQEFYINLLRLSAILCMVIGMNYLLQKTWASGDLEMFFWVVPLVYMVSTWSLPIFYAALLSLYGFCQFLMRVFKLPVFPGTPSIIGAYVLAVLLPLFGTTG